MWKSTYNEKGGSKTVLTLTNNLFGIKQLTGVSFMTRVQTNDNIFSHKA